MKLWPIPVMTAALRCPEWSDGDPGGEGLLRARELGGGVWGKPAASHRWRSFSFFLTRAVVAWERHRGGVQLGCTLMEEEEEEGGA
jgi:hypothetical protein